MPIQRGGYGYDNYSAGDYGTEGVTHSSGTLTVTATSSITAEGGKDVQSGALSVTATSSIASFSADRDRTSSATVNAVVTITASGEDIIYEDTDEYAYGSGLYGMEAYTQGDLQTIVSATSSTAVSNALRVRSASGTSTVTSGESADSEKIFQGSATSSVTSSITADGAFTVNVNPQTISATATTTPSILRLRNATGIVSAESGEMTHGREKWQIISPTSITWTEIAA